MMNIMIVDDEKDVQFLFQQKFRKEIKQSKVKFSFSFSAEEALNFLENHKSNLIVLILADINMPGMNGLELLKIIKTVYPQLKVFMITAYGDKQNYQKAIEYGADDYINKPISFNILKEKIMALSKY